jgi:hypothetical protein
MRVNGPNRVDSFVAIERKSPEQDLLHRYGCAQAAPR